MIARGLHLHDEEVPPVFEASIEGPSIFLIVCDHFGALIPRSLADLGLSATDLKRHIAYDIGISGVASRLSKSLDAHLVAQRYSRLVIDCNRPLIAASSIPTVSETTPIPGNKDLTNAARLERRQLLFDPYHQAIKETIDKRDRMARQTVLISLHSFTPIYHGVSRPWHIGALYNRDRRLSDMIINALRRQYHLVVGDNEPYSVDDETDYTLPVHGEQRGLLHAGIEIRQDLIADESGQHDWSSRLASLFQQIKMALPKPLVKPSPSREK